MTKEVEKEITIQELKDFYNKLNYDSKVNFVNANVVYFEKIKESDPLSVLEESNRQITKTFKEYVKRSGYKGYTQTFLNDAFNSVTNLIEPNVAYNNFLDREHRKKKDKKKISIMAEYLKSLTLEGKIFTHNNWNSIRTLHTKIPEIFYESDYEMINLKKDFDKDLIYEEYESYLKSVFLLDRNSRVLIEFNAVDIDEYFDFPVAKYIIGDHRTKIALEVHLERYEEYETLLSPAYREKLLGEYS